MIRNRRPAPPHVTDFQVSGVLSGFLPAIAASSLTPTVTIGVLYANGQKYAPTTAPTIPACSSTSGTYYLWYNATSGFYWNTSPMTPTTAGDCPVLSAVVAGGAITSVTTVQTVNDPGYGQLGGVATLTTTATPSGGGGAGSGVQGGGGGSNFTL